MSDRKSFAAKAAKEGFASLCMEAIKAGWPYLSPFLFGAAPLIANFFQPVPWVYAIAAAAFVFAAVTIGLFRFTEWRQYRSPMDKLSFETAGMFFDYERDKEGKPIAIKTAQIAVCLRSVAAFSMHYIFETYESSVDGRIFTGKQRAHTGNSVAPFSVTWFYGSIIEMEKTELKASLRVRQELLSRMDERATRNSRLCERFLLGLT